MNTPTVPPCPQCGLENTYPDGETLICPDCGFEWSTDEASDDAGNDDTSVRDANGNLLADGDSVILVKDLKVKGIRLVDGADGHNIDCKTDMGSLLLKSEFVKKA